MITGRRLLVWLSSLFLLPATHSQLVDRKSQMDSFTFQMTNLQILEDSPIGGRVDLLGKGALLLAKRDTAQAFWKTSTFQNEGIWTSQWIESDKDSIDIEWYVYGQKQDMSSGWQKFSGNPLISAHGWKYNTKQTLELPFHYSAQPADQSLVKGAGQYQNQWLLFFNVGGWAVKGWAMAVADSLAPLQRGINPFELATPYPLTKATGGYNAPNDWIFAEGLWYAPDESRDHTSRMWTSETLEHWVLRGAIEGINGHDPGMAYDGEYYYLFNEANDKITLVYAKDPLAKWTEWPTNEGGEVLDIGDHTGDADVAFFNNRWHMFVDDGIHRKYKLSYATTSPEAFPLGWELSQEIFGPYHPDQQQAWDNDNPQGNDFGTGDADIALEGHTLYLSYETPVGLAFKNLELIESSEQSVWARIEYQKGKRLKTTRWIELPPGGHWLTRGAFQENLPNHSWRLTIKLDSSNPLESPMINRIEFR